MSLTIKGEDKLGQIERAIAMSKAKDPKARARMTSHAARKTNTSISLPQDGNVRAYTLSAKGGVIYMFGGL